MDYRYLLDTNILSDLIRNPDGTVTQRVQQHGQEQVCTSIIVACELRFGAAKKASPALSNRIEMLLNHLAILSLLPDVDRHYAQLRHYLEQSGTPIAPNDLLIASQALSLNLTLVSDNVCEFSRVPGLKLDNWL